MSTSTNRPHPARRAAAFAASTASTARSDEDGSTSSARREGSQEPSPPPRLCLTSLPTEVLNNIFSHVPYDDSRRSIEQIVLSKRYFAVAYRHWIRELTLDENDADIVYAEIGTHAASVLVKEIDAFFVPLLLRTQCAVFRHTPNLTHLAVEVLDIDNKTLPICFFAALRTLRHLVHLEIRYDDRDEPVEGFSFERDVPSLRILKINAAGSLAAYGPGLSKLTHLTIPSSDFAAAAVPWETLHHLDIGLLDVGETEFLSSLQDTCKISAIPLRGLALHLSTGTVDDLRCISEILQTIRAPSLTDLIVRGIKSFADCKSWSFSARLPGVSHLTLGGSSNCASTDALRGLRAFLEVCPAA
ncbi:RHTO0S06e03180g1_1 [Rhodotorula toruloides]|uniref:RHTO0S06e03180g1_1 n=1 Tax=Rhodotorula toruloides TaxID=5286 RepID=A0A061AVC9_RHOTO|nr:RHTO0S06e03180g1_1 [Rhodotorula toruloides]